MRYRVEAMRLEHLPTVHEIEKRCFPQPWPQNAYRREIQSNRMAHYFIVRRLEDGADLEPAEVSATGAASTSASHEGGLLGKLARMFRGSGEPPPTSAALEVESKSIVGYAGLWLMTDEAHVTTIAVAPESQGYGIGELLLLGLIDRAQQIGARWLTLEVRVSNKVAQNLYEKYTFKEMGLRRRYYSDNNEDALVMWTDPIESDAFQSAVRRNREVLGRNLGQHD